MPDYQFDNQAFYYKMICISKIKFMFMSNEIIQSGNSFEQLQDSFKNRRTKNRIRINHPA